MPAPSIESVAADAWPSLPLDRWRDTYDTLHLWTQLAGKLALALSPLTNHYWNTALQITPRGLATLPLTADHRSVTAAFDFVAHQLVLECSDGRDRSEEHTSELQSQSNLVCRLLLEKKKKNS